MPTQGQSIIVDTPELAATTAAALGQIAPGHELTAWIMEKVTKWENHRNSSKAKKWAEYWRMWRGQWAAEDQNRGSERSRLIAPALAQAIEMTVSEIEEAVFSREIWFDVSDDLKDQERIDAVEARDLLLEDLDKVNAQDQISEAVLNAAIFGTGIVKISPFVGTAEKAERDEYNAAVRSQKQRVYVTVESIRPDEFIPDPAGRSIDEMLGMAHRVQNRPMHYVLEKIRQGTYRKDALAQLAPAQRPNSDAVDWSTDEQASVAASTADQVDVIEWHGKVPLKLMSRINAPQTEVDRLLQSADEPGDDVGDGEMVEAIVTIGNGSVLLRAMVNPFFMRDRSIIAFQFEKVPGRFWGRGVAEKGYNPQKALDAEIRARIDALGFISAPMLGVDSGRIPRGFKMEIKPGKLWLTQGNPNEVLNPVAIGHIDASTFNQASEMERMVQMGTGAFDTASSLKAQSQSGANSAGSNSMLMGAFVKRAKRAIKNVDRNLLTPIVQKSMWRYMQFDPKRYPQDYEFNVKATLGIIAREVEVAQMSQVIGMLPEEAQSVKLVIAQGMIENSTFMNKAQILQAINQALQPPPPEVAEQQKMLADMNMQAALAQARQAVLENQKTMAEIRGILAKAQADLRKGDMDDDRLVQEQQKLGLMQQEIDQFAEQNKIAMKRLELQEEQLELKRQELAKKPAASSSK